jgi:hypothetical protein
MRRKLDATLYNIDKGILVDHKITFVNEGCMYFFNAQHKLIQLKPIERAYFDFLCEKMNVRNKIALNPNLRKQFLLFYEDILKVEKLRSERTLLSIESKLKNLSLIFQDPRNKRLHYVNPKYVFKGTSTERGRLLRDLVEIAFTNEFVAKAITNVALDSINADERIFNLELPEDVKLCNEVDNYKNSEL